MRGFYRGFPVHFIAMVGAVGLLRVAKRIVHRRPIWGKVETEDFEIYKNSF